MTLRIVAFSDTHFLSSSNCSSLRIPDGDVLICAGDISNIGAYKELANVNYWMRTLPHKHKLLIAGNHDILFDKDQGIAESLIPSMKYLQDSEIIIEGIKFYGTPWQPRFNDWAFNVDSELLLKTKYSIIPDDTDVLITHCPPLGILDDYIGEQLGSSSLLNAVIKIKPAIHIFGHIHDKYGKIERNGTTFANVSLLDNSYVMVNKPMVFEL